MLSLALFALSSSAAPMPLAFHTLTTDQGAITYAIAVPDGRASHAVLALPPGNQDRHMVEAVLAPWVDRMVAAGWLVVSPVAPDGVLFTEASSHGRLPPLLDHVERTHRVRVKEGWHLLGVSNGGRSALVVAPAHPERFASVTVIPGSTSRPEALSALGRTPVTLVVGADDRGWVEASQAAHQALVEAGGNSQLVVLEGQGHMAFKTIDWSRLQAWMLRGDQR